MRGSEPKEILETFRLHRMLTLDLLQSLGNEQLLWRPIKASGSFGKQFRHILDIQRCYVESMINGFLTFFRPHIDHDLEADRERLIQELDLEDGKLEKFFENIQWQKANEKYIDCSQVVQYLGNDKVRASPIQILSWLTEHEILHDGELALYVKTAELKFPGSWMIWGLK